MRCEIRGLSVLNSLAANRRLAYRMVAVQAVVAMLVALAFFAAQGTKQALAAAIGGGAVALGSLALAWRSLPSTPKSAGWSISRMVSGLMVKWFVVLGVLYVAMAKLAMPPLPLVVGLAATAMAALVPAMNSKA
jgi:F0F1-type ATP synthase assembly protein I